MITATELNAIYGDFLKSFSTPVKIDMSGGVTEIPKDNFGAFELNPAHSKNIKLEKTKDGGVVIRYAFGYDFANSTLRNYHQGIRFLSIVQNEMALTISPYIDWTKTVPNLFHRPNMPDKFFLKLSTHAGFELRAYYDGSV
jgi:hypothetical protein